MNRTTLRRMVVATFVALATSAVLAQGIMIAPPPPRTEVVPPARMGYVWNPGHWRWVRGRYVWVGGNWQRARTGHNWVPGRWVRHGRSWQWAPAHWA